jgi:hypothetical protein
MAFARFDQLLPYFAPTYQLFPWNSRETFYNDSFEKYFNFPL